MDTKNINVSAYRDAVAAIGVLEGRGESFKESTRREIHRIEYEVYGPRIRALEDERDAEVSLKKRAQEFHHEEIQREIIGHREVTSRVGRLLDLMQLIEEGGDRGELKVGVYRPRPSAETLYEAIGDVSVDQYKVVRAYIITNRKPTNRYSLVVIGSSTFPRDYLRGRQFDYLNGVNYTGDFMVILREGPDSDALLAWYTKHGTNGTLDEFFQDHAGLERDYETAKELLKDPEWVRLHLEHMQHYYEHGVSRGTETPEYAEITKRLSELG